MLVTGRRCKTNKCALSVCLALLWREIKHGLALILRSDVINQVILNRPSGQALVIFQRLEMSKGMGGHACLQLCTVQMNSGISDNKWQ